MPVTRTRQSNRTASSSGSKATTPADKVKAPPKAKKPKKAKPPPKPTKPTPTDPSTWRASNLRPTQRISATAIGEKYKLSKSDIENAGLQLRYESAGSSYYNKAEKKVIAASIKTYVEQEVERLAWEKHGSPEGFDFYIQDLRQKLDARRAKAAAKAASRTNEEILEDLWTDTRGLRTLKKEFPAEWLWKACNKSLGIELSGSEREQALRTVFGTPGLGPYPTRPTSPLPVSPSLDNLRAVLDVAPTLPASKNWGKSIEGLEYWDDGFSGDSGYLWAISYREQILRALIEVGKAHGLEQEGWKGARWLVYDKYANCIAGIHRYSDGRDRWWVDDAEGWLFGQMDTSDYRCQQTRGGCPSELEYNNMLPAHRLGVQ